MKKRILALVLVLMLAITLFPAYALADGDIYVSVGGKAFTQLNQTINVGGGTAKLTWEAVDPLLTLNNVNLTAFENLGSSDGVTYYAGLVYSGDNALNVAFNNCTITAPNHGGNAYYEGIYAEGMIRMEGKLTIKNMDVGIEADSVYSYGANLTVSSKGGPAVYGSSVDFHNSNVNISTVGTSAVIADSFNVTGDYENSVRKGSVNINLTTDAAYDYDHTIAASASRITIEGNINVTVNADLSGYKGKEAISCSALAAGEAMTIRRDSTVNSVLNVKCAENVVATGIFAEDISMDGKIKSTVNVGGERTGVVGIGINNISRSDGGWLESSVTGAEDTDIAIAILKASHDLVLDGLYASTDCENGMAIVFAPNTQIVKEVFGENLNILTPKGGSYITADVESPLDELTEINTVVDENGKPANVVIMSKKDYAFNDIDTTNVAPYKNAILWAVQKGITTGFTPVEFRPSASCTRGQVVTFLWRANGCPEPETAENPFVDVQETSPFYKAILWAYENGITTGFDETHFKPSNPCTRGQVVTFLWRAKDNPVPENAENPFSDVSDTGNCAPYYTAILWAAEQGITTGFNDGTFRPSSTCSRGQIVTFIYRDMAE